MLEVGTKVKDFSLPDGFGQTHHLSDYLGKKIVLYFYPEDDSPGCTEQACTFKDVTTDLIRQNVVLLGISPDGVDAHKSFVTKYGLPFTLLSDEDKKVSTYFGAYGTKNLYGKIVEGIIRSTFIIDEQGKIEKVFKRAFAKSNASSVLAYIKG
jgi:thioredoxin-dependent peroxiredoxin